MTYTADEYREYAKTSPAVKRYRNSEKAKVCREKYKASAKGKAVNAQRDLRRREQAKAIVCEYRSQPCSDCGGIFPPVCMDFHHVRGTKAFEIAGGSRRTATALKKEIEKCIVICANCHRLRHTKAAKQAALLGR